MTEPARSREPTSPASSAGPVRPALADVYRDHFSFAWRSARRLGCSEADAEDVVQESFLVVHRRLEDFDPSRSFRAWLFGIVWRVARTRARGRKRAVRRLQLVATPDPVETPERELERARAAQLVREFLDTLDEARRVAFVLSELEGFTGTEVAEVLQVNRNTVYTRVRSARKKFERFARRRGWGTEISEEERR